MKMHKYNKKYREKAIITPRQFLCYRRKKEGEPSCKPPNSAILCYSWKLFDYILQNYKTTKIKGFVAEAYFINDTDNQVAVFSKFGIGASGGAILIEELIAFGIRNFIIIGNAAAVQENLKIGDIVLCQKAIRDEGVSRHYIKPSKFVYPSQKLNQKIKETFKRANIKYQLGTAWTIDAMYRETTDKVRKYRKEGVLTVELEASALFAVAQFRKVHISAIFIISDSIAKLRWKPGWHFKQAYNSLKKAYYIALTTLTS